MKIVTSEFIQLFKDFPFYSQSKIEDPLVVAKLFNPMGAATWYLTEYDPESNEAFGFVVGFDVDEFGFVSLDEVESCVLPFGLTIERDLYFTQAKLSSFVAQQ